MSSLPPLRLLIDPPASGAWNMAVDEVLLTTAAERGVCSLRFYEWSEPTLSLGYFQAYAGRGAHPKSRRCPVVRRASGGGAILHDQELTYCLALDESHPLAGDVTGLYTRIHEALVAALARWHITAELSAGRRLPPEDEPFLCFSRRACGDVLIEGAKICGSAQRRRAGAVVQHGSILLARSDEAPELPGIAELTGVRLKAGDLVDVWRPHLELVLGTQWQPAPLTDTEKGLVRSLTIEKYDGASWTRRR